MEDDARPLDELADDVLAGRPVDWASVESPPDPRRREAVRQLKALAGIAELHRTIASETTLPELPHWGRLKILERIGQGSFGDVYRAWDTKLDREVALKLLRSDAVPERGAEVLKEARLLARVRHPNVAIVYDADEIDGRVGLWMEFIHGKNLEEVLAEKKKLDGREVTRIGIDLCRALAAVHEAGLLHRDIKAQNVMRADDGRLVLMDFGTGSDLESSSGATDAAGTPLYLAPEIFQGSPATVRSDIYGVGVLLFHLLTGSYPLRGEDVGAIALAHSDATNAAREAIPDASRPLGRAVARALAPDPSRRFSSVREMLSALESASRSFDTRRRTRQKAAVAFFSLVVLTATIVPTIRLARGGSKSPRGFTPTLLGAPAERRAVPVPPMALMGTPSPDGRYVPFADMNAMNLALYELETGNTRVLTRSADGGDKNYAGESVVSADGARVAYAWWEGACRCWQVRVVDTNGNDERVLYRNESNEEILPLEWSQDGEQLLGTRSRGGGQADVVLLSTSDGTVRLVRTISGLGRVTLSPDRRFIAYDRLEGPNDSDRGIFLSGIETDREVSVAVGRTFDTNPMWVPGGGGLVFVSTRTGEPGLWLQPVRDGRSDGPPRLLDKEMGPFAPLTLTRTGSLFYLHRTGLMDVFIAPIDPATGAVVGEPKNAAVHVMGSNICAGWSPDGATLVFASWRTPKRNILVFHTLATDLEREVELDFVANGVHWSPDGRYIALGGPDGRGFRALRLIDPATGQLEATALAGSSFTVTSTGFDPDGLHVFQIRDTARVSRVDLATGQEEKLYEAPPDSVLGSLSVSPDGRWVTFTLALRSEGTQRLVVIPATGGGTPRTLLDVPGGILGVGGWTRDGKRVFLVQTTRDSENKHLGDLWTVPLDGSAATRAGLTMRALRDVRVSPDGTNISFTSGYPETDLWVFENFLPKAGVH